MSDNNYDNQTSPIALLLEAFEEVKSISPSKSFFRILKKEVSEETRKEVFDKAENALLAAVENGALKNFPSDKIKELTQGLISLYELDPQNLLDFPNQLIARENKINIKLSFDAGFLGKSAPNQENIEKARHIISYLSKAGCLVLSTPTLKELNEWSRGIKPGSSTKERETQILHAHQKFIRENPVKLHNFSSSDLPLVSKEKTMAELEKIKNQNSTLDPKAKPRP